MLKANDTSFVSLSLSRTIIAAQRVERNSPESKKKRPCKAYATEVRIDEDQLLESLTAKEAGKPDDRRGGSERDWLK